MKRSRYLLGAVGTWLVTTIAPAHADVFFVRDAEGVLHFSNVPAEESEHFVPEGPLTDRHIPDRPPGPSPIARSSDRYDDLIREHAARYEVEFALVKAVIRAESGFNRLAVSRKGARGLMQLMPKTARLHGVRNWFDPDENIRGGVEHLRTLIDEHDPSLVRVIAAYNAGSAAVLRHRGIPPFSETRTYVSRVLRYRRLYQREERARLLASRAPAFRDDARIR